MQQPLRFPDATGLMASSSEAPPRPDARAAHLMQLQTADFEVGGGAPLQDRRVLLVYPPVRVSSPPLYPPFGLMSIAAVLEHAGATVEILDLNLLRLPFDEVMAEIGTRRFDVIGIGGMTTVYYYMKLLSLALKRAYPDVPVIGGGSACSASPRTILERTGIDVACVGEGEPVIVELIQRLLEGSDLSAIPGICYLDDSATVIETAGRPRMANIEDLPYPAYHLVDLEPYIANTAAHKYPLVGRVAERVAEAGIDPERARRPVMLFAKRGCPFACNFCYRNFGRKVVPTSVEHTLAHIDLLAERYSTAHFVFGDEIFNIDKDWVRAFCERVIAEDRRYVFGTINGLRANLIDEPLLDVMRRAGFCSIGIGIESFYDPTLKAMRKGQKAEQIVRALRLARQAGFEISSAQLLFGYETDGRASMRANVEALDALGFEHAGFSIPCPYPGTELYDIARDRGLIEDEEAWLMELADRDISDRVINLSGMSDAALHNHIAWGLDQLHGRALRRRHPVLGRLATGLQAIGRKLGLDPRGTARRLIRHFRNHGPATPPADIAIREEAFALLRTADWAVAEVRSPARSSR